MTVRLADGVVVRRAVDGARHSSTYINIRIALHSLYPQHKRQNSPIQKVSFTPLPWTRKRGSRVIPRMVPDTHLWSLRLSVSGQDPKVSGCSQVRSPGFGQKVSEKFSICLFTFQGRF
jgi:hypothetical protein